LDIGAIHVNGNNINVAILFSSINVSINDIRVPAAIILQTDFLAAFQGARLRIRRSGITVQIYETMHM